MGDETLGKHPPPSSPLPFSRVPVLNLRSSHLAATSSLCLFLSSSSCVRLALTAVNVLSPLHSTCLYLLSLPPLHLTCCHCLDCHHYTHSTTAPLNVSSQYPTCFHSTCLHYTTFRHCTRPAIIILTSPPIHSACHHQAYLVIVTPDLLVTAVIHTLISRVSGCLAWRICPRVF